MPILPSSAPVSRRMPGEDAAGVTIRACTGRSCRGDAGAGVEHGQDGLPGSPVAEEQDHVIADPAEPVTPVLPVVVCGRQVTPAGPERGCAPAIGAFGVVSCVGRRGRRGKPTGSTGRSLHLCPIEDRDTDQQFLLARRDRPMRDGEGGTACEGDPPDLSCTRSPAPEGRGSV